MPQRMRESVINNLKRSNPNGGKDVQPKLKAAIETRDHTLLLALINQQQKIQMFEERKETTAYQSSYSRRQKKC